MVIQETKQYYGILVNKDLSVISSYFKIKMAFRNPHQHYYTYIFLLGFQERKIPLFNRGVKSCPNTYHFPRTAEAISMSLHYNIFS